MSGGILTYNFSKYRHILLILYLSSLLSLQVSLPTSKYKGSLIRPFSSIKVSHAETFPTISISRIQPDVFKREVNICRSVAVACFAIVMKNFSWINQHLQTFYTGSLARIPFFHHYAFEPILASTCFAVYISYYAIIDYLVPSLWKYRIQPTDSMLAWKERLRDAISFEVPLYLGFWIPFGGILRARKVQQSTSLSLVCREVIMALIIYDLIFFCGHSLLHKVPYLYKNIHAKHHAMGTVRAGDSVRHSAVDGFFDVVCAVSALLILKANAMSRSVFNIIAIGLIVDAHCGMNFPWMLSNVIPFDLMAGSLSHDIHHRRGSSNYQKFFTYLDSLFGTRSSGMGER